MKVLLAAGWLTRGVCVRVRSCVLACVKIKSHLCTPTFWKPFSGNAGKSFMRHASLWMWAKKKNSFIYFRYILINLDERTIVIIRIWIKKVFVLCGFHNPFQKTMDSNHGEPLTPGEALFRASHERVLKTMWSGFLNVKGLVSITRGDLIHLVSV